MFELLKEINLLKEKVEELIEYSKRLEYEKEVMFKKLILKEGECAGLKYDCERLRKKCEIKDRIINCGGKYGSNSMCKL